MNLIERAERGCFGVEKHVEHRLDGIDGEGGDMQVSVE